MPIVEYRCGHCGRVSSFFTKAIGRRVEESFSRYGMEMPGPVREVIEAAREGQLPKGLDE